MNNSKTEEKQKYMMAGGRAVYDAFYRELGVTRWKSWDKLTSVRQARWVRIFEIGFNAAQATRQ